MMFNKEEVEARRICMIKLNTESPQIPFMSAAIVFHSAFGCPYAISSISIATVLAHQIAQQLWSCI